MSLREELSNRIEAYLREQPTFNAPYGVLSHKHASGAYREITFGRARWLDASIRVYGLQYIMIKWDGTIRSEGGRRGGYVFKGPRAEQALMDYLQEM